MSTANHISAHNLPYPKRFSADQASLHVVSCDNLPVPATPSSLFTTYPSDRAEKCPNDTTNSVFHEHLLYGVRLRWACIAGQGLSASVSRSRINQCVPPTYHPRIPHLSIRCCPGSDASMVRPATCVNHRSERGCTPQLTWTCFDGFLIIQE